MVRFIETGKKAPKTTTKTKKTNPTSNIVQFTIEKSIIIKTGNGMKNTG